MILDWLKDPETNVASQKITLVSAVATSAVLGALPVLLTIVSIAYVSAQLYFLLRDKWWRERKAKREQQEEGRND